MNIDADIVTKSFAVERFDDLIEDIVAELQARNYRVTRINHIDNVLDQEERGLSDKMSFMHYKIVEFCNLNGCAKMMSAHALAGVFMPAKFAVYQGAGERQVHVSFLRPTSFAALLDSSGVMEVARELEQDMSDVLAETAF